MTDIHAHILFGIDDGPSEIEQSLEMCAVSRRNGFDTVIATPHCLSAEEIEGVARLRDRRIEALREALKQAKIELRILGGMELTAGEEMLFVPSLREAVLAKSRYLLLEFSPRSCTPGRIIKYTGSVLDAGLVPVIAHAERYLPFQEDYDLLNYVSDMGALLQVDVRGLSGRGPSGETKLAHELVRGRIASFLATDAHSPQRRSTDLSRYGRSFPRDISGETLRFMLSDAPDAVARDEALPAIARERAKKHE